MVDKTAMDKLILDKIYGESEDSDYSGADEIVDNLMQPQGTSKYANAVLSVRDQAIMQMEHANLYRALLESSFFEPNSARPEIQDLVESEIKDFIEGKLIELLNIESDRKPKTTSSPFTEEEISALKHLSARVTAKMPQSQTVQSEVKPQVKKMTTTTAPVPTVKSLSTKSPTVKQVQSPAPVAPAQQTSASVSETPNDYSKNSTARKGRKGRKQMSLAQKTMLYSGDGISVSDSSGNTDLANELIKRALGG